MWTGEFSVLKICPTRVLASDQVSEHTLPQFLYSRSYLFLYLNAFKLPWIRPCKLVSSCLTPGKSHYAPFMLEGILTQRDKWGKEPCWSAHYCPKPVIFPLHQWDGRTTPRGRKEGEEEWPLAEIFWQPSFVLLRAKLRSVWPWALCDAMTHILQMSCLHVDSGPFIYMSFSSL